MRCSSRVRALLDTTRSVVNKSPATCATLPPSSDQHRHHTALPSAASHPSPHTHDPGNCASVVNKSPAVRCLHSCSFLALSRDLPADRTRVRTHHATLRCQCPQKRDLGSSPLAAFAIARLARPEWGPGRLISDASCGSRTPVRGAGAGGVWRLRGCWTSGLGCCQLARRSAA